MKLETLRSICVGICAANMGVVEVSRLIATGNETAKFISRLTYRQFREIKKQAKQKEVKDEKIN